MKRTVRAHRQVVWLARSACVVAIALVGGAVWTGRASASCSPSNHCYAIDDWTPSGSYIGARADISESRLSGVSAGNFIDNEFWVFTNSSQNVWVETGQTRGQVDGVWRDYGLFWAEQDTRGIYAEHFIRTFTLGEIVTQKIAYVGGGNWGIYVNGTLNNYSTIYHGSTVHEIHGGIESTTSSAGLTGELDQIHKQGSAGTWSYGWPGTISKDSPLDFGWITAWWDAYDSEN